MVDDVFGELFLDDEADEGGVSVPLMPPVTVPAPDAAATRPAPVRPELEPELMVPISAEVADRQEHRAAPIDPGAAPSPVPAESAVAPASPADAPVQSAAVPAQAPPPAENRSERERRLADALNTLMRENHDVEAAALVSLDGFTMASALPNGMQEDRVGAMSAAILGLGERAAAELGKGKLSQVFIEGEDGYVLLMAAGDRAVLTCLADHRAKLGLVIFDMRRAAGAIGEVLG